MAHSRGSVFSFFAAAAGVLALVGLVPGCGGAAPSELLEGTGSTSTVDGGPTTDSGSHDGSAGADAQDGSTGGDPGVLCPSSGYCPVPGQVCCKQASGDTCVSAGACSGLAIPCDDAADCAAAGMPGAVCCLSDATNGAASSVQCLPPSQCTAMQGRTAICDKTIPGACPSGLSCQPSQQSLPGFDICR